MQEVTIYLAMDGTVFNAEIDCIEYELKHDLDSYGITFYDNLGHKTIDATLAKRIRIECDVIPESLLDAIYSYCGATELPKTKGIWDSMSGDEQYYMFNTREFCKDCSYYHDDYGESKPCCHNDCCHEYGWVKER